jgi:hypothetical protein
MLGLLEVRSLHELCEDNKFRDHLGCTDLRETIKTDEMHEMHEKCGFLGVGCTTFQPHERFEMYILHDLHK